MKNLKRAIVLFNVIVLFIACSSDNGNSQTDNSQILGVWNLTEITEDGTTITTIQGTETTAIFSSFGKDMNAQLTLTQNPNEFTSSGSYTSVITTVAFGQQITQEVPINDFFGSGSWQVNGNILTTTNNGDEQSAEILELTSSLLRLKETFDEEIILQGATVKTNIIIFYTLTK